MAVGGIALAGNALSKQYEQFAPLSYNAQLTGELAGGSRRDSARLFNEALDAATASAVKFGTTIESMRLKNAYGANEYGTLGLNSLFERYSNEKGASISAIAMHQASGQSNASIDESVEALSQIFEQGLTRGFAGTKEKLSLSILSLSQSMKYSGSDKNYSTKDAGRLAGRIDQGFAAAAAINKDSDLLAVQAAMKMGDGGKSLQEAREILEGGYSQNPELLSSYMEMISGYSKGHRIELMRQNFGLNYTESGKILENYRLGKPLSEKDMRTIGDAQARLNPIQSILGETQGIRRGIAGIAITGIMDYKMDFSISRMGLAANMGKGEAVNILKEFSSETITIKKDASIKETVDKIIETWFEIYSAICGDKKEGKDKKEGLHKIYDQ